MHHRPASATHCDRARTGQERSLIDAAFVGSYPAPDFQTDPSLPEIGILGRSNVGKSTLINALVGRKSLARTSRTPGKTRSCNVYRIDERYYIVDLPGYGYAKASKRVRQSLRRLLEQYLAERVRLAGVLWLLDIRRDPSPDDLTVGQLLHRRQLPTLLAITKGDKFGRGRQADRRRAILDSVQIPRDQCVVTSSQTGEGISELRDAIDEFVTHVT